MGRTVVEGLVEDGQVAEEPRGRFGRARTPASGAWSIGSSRGGWLIITTPNATRLNLSIATAAGLELNHPDHVQIFSWYTLTSTLARHGWSTEEVCTYLTPRDYTLYGPRPLKWRLVDGAQRVATHRISPFYADGLIAVCAAQPV